MGIIRIVLAVVFSALLVFGISKYIATVDQDGVDQKVSGIWWFILPEKEVASWVVEEAKDDQLLDILWDIAEHKEKLQEDQELVLHEDFTMWTLSSDEVERITALGVKWWNTLWDVLWLHYCDFDVEYCQTSYDEGSLYDYQEVYPALQYIYKPFPPTSQEEDLLPHRAAMCVMQLWTSKQFFSYYNGLYQQRNLRSDIGELINFGLSLGVEDIAGCIEENNFDLAIQQEKKLAVKLFGLRSLPANIFINVKSSNWILVPWRYEPEIVANAIRYAIEAK